MNKEEIVTELLENCTWDVFAGNIWVNKSGILHIPWDDGDTEDHILLDPHEWVESCGDEEDLLDLTEEDRAWVDEQIAAHFTERYRAYLTEQLDLLQGSNNA